MNTAGSATLSFGLVSLPVKLGKADTDDGVDLSSRCECGAGVEPKRNEDGDAVICKSDDCDRSYSWWNSVPARVYEAGDDEIPLAEDELDAARDEVPVDTGHIEKVCPVKEVLLHYAVTGNYYVVPSEDDFGEQYAVIERVLDAEDLAMLTYLSIGKTRRYAIIAEGGVLLALQLADKKPLDERVNFDADDAMVDQARSLLESERSDDPALDDVADHGLKQLIRDKIATDADEGDEPEAAPEPEPEPTAETDGGDPDDDRDDDPEESADDAEDDAEQEVGQTTLV